MEKSRLEDVKIDSVDFVKGSGDDPHARIKIAKASGDSKGTSGKSYFDQILESRRAGEEKQRVSELTSVLADAVEMAASPDEIEQLTAQYVQAVRQTMAKGGEHLEINKSTGSFLDRAEIEKVISKAADETFPDERSAEARLGKLAVTREGRTLRRMARELPEPEPQPALVEKDERSGTEVLLDREAARIAKRDGVSREAAYGKVKREAPASLLDAYRASRGR